jgi:hypothetical protein
MIIGDYGWTDKQIDESGYIRIINNGKPIKGYGRCNYKQLIDE